MSRLANRCLCRYYTMMRGDRHLCISSLSFDSLTVVDGLGGLMS
jgi:hypothetical protein